MDYTEQLEKSRHRTRVCLITLISDIVICPCLFYIMTQSHKAMSSTIMDVKSNILEPMIDFARGEITMAGVIEGIFIAVFIVSIVAGIASSLETARYEKNIKEQQLSVEPDLRTNPQDKEGDSMDSNVQDNVQTPKLPNIKSEYPEGSLGWLVDYVKSFGKKYIFGFAYYWLCKNGNITGTDQETFRRVLNSYGADVSVGSMNAGVGDAEKLAQSGQLKSKNDMKKLNYDVLEKQLGLVFPKDLRILVVEKNQ